MYFFLFVFSLESGIAKSFPVLFLQFIVHMRLQYKGDRTTISESRLHGLLSNNVVGHSFYVYSITHSPNRFMDALQDTRPTGQFGSVF